MDRATGGRVHLSKEITCKQRQEVRETWDWKANNKDSKEGRWSGTNPAGWRPQNLLYYKWKVDPLGSDNATWFQGLLAGPTAEILDFLQQNLSHSLPVGTNWCCYISYLLIVSTSALGLESKPRYWQNKLQTQQSRNNWPQNFKSAVPLLAEAKSWISDSCRIP